MSEITIFKPTEDLRKEVRETAQRLRKTAADAQRAIEKMRVAVEAARRLRLSEMDVPAEK